MRRRVIVQSMEIAKPPLESVYVNRASMVPDVNRNVHMEHLAHTVCQNACARMVPSAQRSMVHVHANVAGLEFSVTVNVPMATLVKTVQNDVDVRYMQCATNLMVLVAAPENTKGHIVTKNAVTGHLVSAACKAVFAIKRQQKAATPFQDDVHVSPAGKQLTVPKKENVPVDFMDLGAIIIAIARTMQHVVI